MKGWMSQVARSSETHGIKTWGAQGMQEYTELPLPVYAWSMPSISWMIQMFSRGCFVAWGHEIRTLVLDNATNHSLVKNFLLGLRHGLPQEKLDKLFFFSELEYLNFPDSCLPRWPFRKPRCPRDSEILLLDLLVFLVLTGSISMGHKQKSQMKLVIYFIFFDVGGHKVAWAS